MIYGTPGKNLEDGQAGLDRSRRIVGRAGELATAAVLRRLEAAHPEMPSPTRSGCRPAR